MNHLIVAGLNYHSAPISVREQFAIAPSAISCALAHLKQLPHVEEAAILSTCNRTEVYAVVSDIQTGWHELETFFAAYRQISDLEKLKPNFKLLGDDVALHLMRVASGLNSLVVGEGQILAQLKAAHQAALEAKSIGPILDHTFSLAISCGKRVRSQTGISRRAVSASSAALEVGRAVFGELKDKNVLIVGAGQMAHLCLKQLVSEVETGKITVVNRNRRRIEDLIARKFQGTKATVNDADYNRRQDMLKKVDLVIVATSAPDFVFPKEDLEKHRIKRKKPLCIIDIAVPRNVDPSIQELEGVLLFNADDLASIVSANLVKREALMAEAEKIIFEALADFQRWQRTLKVVPTIAALRERIETIRVEQTEKLLRIRGGDKLREGQLDQLGRSIVRRILHDPSIKLKSKSAKDEKAGDLQAAILDFLFNLSLSTETGITTTTIPPVTNSSAPDCAQATQSSEILSSTAGYTNAAQSPETLSPTVSCAHVALAPVTVSPLPGC